MYEINNICNCCACLIQLHDIFIEVHLYKIIIRQVLFVVANATQLIQTRVVFKERLGPNAVSV